MLFEPGLIQSSENNVQYVCGKLELHGKVLCFLIRCCSGEIARAVMRRVYYDAAAEKLAKTFLK